jgi:formylmethanofuran dehydrogenase subunit C
MSLLLRLRAGALPDGEIDAAALCPDRLAGRAPREVARHGLGNGGPPVPIGDLFAVVDDGAAEKDSVTIEGDLGRFTRVGAGMSRGRLEVRGGVGARAGSGMTGGRLEIDGDAGPRAGEGMTGGAILVGGSAGERLGAPMEGRVTGIDGGVIIVRGDAGPLAGFRMRRGTLVVSGRAGEAAGAALIAGTLVFLRTPGADTGVLMRRGTIVVLASFVPGAGFAPAGVSTAAWLQPWWEALGAAGVPLPPGLSGARFARWSGDLTEGGRGEVLTLEEGR